MRNPGGPGKTRPGLLEGVLVVPLLPCLLSAYASLDLMGTTFPARRRAARQRLSGASARDQDGDQLRLSSRQFPLGPYENLVSLDVQGMGRQESGLPSFTLNSRSLEIA